MHLWYRDSNMSGVEVTRRAHPRMELRNTPFSEIYAYSLEKGYGSGQRWGSVPPAACADAAAAAWIWHRASSAPQSSIGHPASSLVRDRSWAMPRYMAYVRQWWMGWRPGDVYSVDIRTDCMPLTLLRRSSKLSIIPACVCHHHSRGALHFAY